MRRGFLLCAGLLVAVAASCTPDDQRTDTLDAREGMTAREEMGSEVVAQLDSGSMQVRADNHEAALVHYRRVTELAPDVAAGWFGVYMAERALGNLDAAAEALERARSSEPGATLIHPTEADTLP